MKILSLHLKAEYFHQIKNGTKLFEYRLYNDYWKKKLENKSYDEVHFKLGYPSHSDLDKIIKCKYNGYEMQNINHSHFCNLFDESVRVFAIIIKENN